MFIVSDRADGYFVSSPLEWDCEVLLRKMFRKTWISYLRYAQSSGDLIGCVWKIRGLDFELCRGRNFIEWADKGLGGLEKNSQYFKGERKKEDKKKGTRKLLKRCEIHRLTVVKSWKKTGKDVSWFDYELCLVVEG